MLDNKPAMYGGNWNKEALATPPTGPVEYDHAMCEALGYHDVKQTWRFHGGKSTMIEVSWSYYE